MGIDHETGVIGSVGDRFDSNTATVRATGPG